MTLSRIERILNALYVLAFGMYAGIVVELFAAEHTQEPSQYIPYVMCAIGVVVTGAVWFRPWLAASRWPLIVMLVIGFSGAVGTYFHFMASLNYINANYPGTPWSDKLLQIFHSPVPLFAPFALAAAACVSMIAFHMSEGLALRVRGQEIGFH